MKGFAHISFVGGGLIVPVQTPYERELLVEHLEASAKRHGSVQTEVDRRHWTVVSLSKGHREMCAACSRHLDRLRYRLDGRTLCGECAGCTLQ
jgi:hypothetical protein